MNKFMILSGNGGGYGDRIYIHKDQDEAISFLKDHCVWGGHDKTLRNDDGVVFLGFEFGTVEFLVAYQALIEHYGLVLMSFEETINTFCALR